MTASLSSFLLALDFAPSGWAPWDILGSIVLFRSSENVHLSHLAKDLLCSFFVGETLFETELLGNVEEILVEIGFTPASPSSLLFEPILRSYTLTLHVT